MTQRRVGCLVFCLAAQHPALRLLGGRRTSCAPSMKKKSEYNLHLGGINPNAIVQAFLISKKITNLFFLQQMFK
jgi:hypothetical protein